jgi:hypothetical protein
MKIIALACVGALVALTAAGCYQASAQETTPQEPPKTLKKNEIARINERVFTAEEFIERFVEREKQYFDPDMRTATAALDSLILDELYNLEVVRLGAGPKRLEIDAEFTAIIDTWKAEMAETNKGLPVPYTWEEYVKAKTGLTLPQFDEKVRAFALENIPRRMVVNYWILSTDSAEAQGLMMTNLEKLLEVRTRLVKGESLAALARKHSEDSNSQANLGDIGTVYVKDGSMEPEVAEAFWQLEPGQWSGAIKAGDGYWLVRKGQFYPGNKAEFFDLRDECFRRPNPTYRQLIQWRHAMASSGRYVFERRMPGWDVQAGE